MDLLEQCELLVVSRDHQTSFVNQLRRVIGHPPTVTDAPLDYHWKGTPPGFRVALVNYQFHRTHRNKLVFYNQLTERCKVALYDALPDLEIERLALMMGISGLFLESDTMPVVRKGINTILAGELWFRRRVVASTLKEMQHNQEAAVEQKLKQANGQVLTERESSILQRVGYGATNQQIADQLSISVHTVRTHMYRIYKKLDARNRVDAINRVNDSTL